jgi:hypothetical protein
VTDYPPSVLAAATQAIRDQFRDDLDKPGAPEADALARAALEAAAPLLAEAWGAGKPKPTRPATEKLNPCHWCGKRNRTASEWEQEGLKGGWYRLCVRCASSRLRNPWNALLPMRKTGSDKEKADAV